MARQDPVRSNDPETPWFDGRTYELGGKPCKS